MSNRLTRTTLKINSRPIKVIQFGSGNFLRGFADYMIDIMNDLTSFNGNVRIIQSVSSSDNAINRQDGLYHVLVKGLSKGETVSEIRLITCVEGTLQANNDFEGFVTLASLPTVEFVISNTTESGITYIDEPFREDSISTTFPGKLTRLLWERFNKKLKGIIVIPCELIERNGDMLREVVLKYASSWLLSDDFKQWIRDENVFCNTLVDRIVPGFSSTVGEEVKERTGYEDNAAVMVEPYSFLAIQAPDFVRALFPAEVANLPVKFVEDISNYRLRKVRILNGAHTAMMAYSYLRGFRTVREALHDKDIERFVTALIDEEIIPTLPQPVDELKSFSVEVMDRLKNPFLDHQLSSIALNSIDKFNVRLLPTLLEYFKRTGKTPPRIAQALAALIVFYRGQYHEQSIPIQDNQAVKEIFQNAWQAGIESSLPELLANKTLWRGNNLNLLVDFKESVQKGIVALLNREGITNNA
jgi:tagaturonate reductase